MAPQTPLTTPAAARNDSTSSCNDADLVEIGKKTILQQQERCESCHASKVALIENDSNNNNTCTDKSPLQSPVNPSTTVQSTPDLNDIKVTTKPVPPVSCQESNERNRNLIGSCFKHLSTNLNVLVIGSNNSGKTSLINSMNMAFHQEWKDRARYCPGRLHVIDECVVFRNRSRNSKVVFWDSRGFEDIHEDSHAVLILRYVLEGRIASKCIPCVLLMSKELIKKRYHRVVDPLRRIDLVLFVSDITQAPNRHLMGLVEQAISASKYSSIHNVPVLSVCTKTDSLTTLPPSNQLNEYNLELLRCQRRQTASDDTAAAALKQVCGRRPVLLVDNYKCELEPFSDESLNPSEVQPCPERDARLLQVWKEIIQSTAACGANGNDWRKRTYSPARRTTLGCLPFRFNYSGFRLRSASI